MLTPLRSIHLFLDTRIVIRERTSRDRGATTVFTQCSVAFTANHQPSNPSLLTVSRSPFQSLSVIIATKQFLILSKSTVYIRFRVAEVTQSIAPVEFV
ncbi:MAG: hypothetical protein CLLPBCKN_000645 [Chroococcidiopsis cubana SAG 39.79]|nr:hypothetical protein [Chroococcidiopsis cubana SAG 39.79]